MERIEQRLVGDYELTASAVDSAGDPVDITGTVTVTITDPLGETIVDAATPSIVDGSLVYDLDSADAPLVGEYLAVWTGYIGSDAQSWVTEFEIVGGFYFTLAELRAQSAELESTVKFPDATLEVKRQEAEEDWEAIAHRAFVPRLATIHARADGELISLHHRDVRSVVQVKSAGVAIDITDVTTDPIVGGIRRSSWPTGILEVTYTHGKDAPPAAVKRAVMLLARIYALPSSIDPRATAVINSDFGGYRISVADRTGRTGLPDVDAAAARYGDNTPVVG